VQLGEWSEDERPAGKANHLGFSHLQSGTLTKIELERIAAASPTPKNDWTAALLPSRTALLIPAKSVAAVMSAVR
jgi:hypothetical protein